MLRGALKGVMQSVIMARKILPVSLKLEFYSIFRFFWRIMTMNWRLILLIFLNIRLPLKQLLFNTFIEEIYR